MDNYNSDDVVGIFLYAKTSEEFQLTNESIMGGNIVSIKLLNLNFPSSYISNQLVLIVDEHLKMETNDIIN